ncbi:MAG: hypothetical protein WD355_12310 [Balneolaceae bacterium]
MKNRRKKLAVIIGAMMFALMMAFSVTTSMNGTDFSLSGLQALAGGTSGNCEATGGESMWMDDGLCPTSGYWWMKCKPGGTGCNVCMQYACPEW